MTASVLHLQPEAREGLDQALAALQTAQRSGHGWAVAEAHLGLARCYSALDSQGMALDLLQKGLAYAQGVDQHVELLCERITTLAQQAATLESQRTGSGRADRDRARDHIFETSRLAGGVADPRWEVKVLLHLSDVLDRFGDRDDAVNLQTRALRLMQHPGGESAIDPSQLVSLGRLADG
jgi:hypothetical protein